MGRVRMRSKRPGGASGTTPCTSLTDSTTSDVAAGSSSATCNTPFTAYPAPEVPFGDNVSCTARPLPPRLTNVPTGSGSGAQPLNATSGTAAVTAILATRTAHLATITASVQGGRLAQRVTADMAPGLVASGGK